MYERGRVLGHIAQFEEAIRRIERRFEGISSAQDFVADDRGLDRLDAIAMMLITIGEGIKKVDRITGENLLVRYPEVP